MADKESTNGPPMLGRLQAIEDEFQAGEKADRAPGRLACGVVFYTGTAECTLPMGHRPLDHGVAPEPVGRAEEAGERLLREIFMDPSELALDRLAELATKATPGPWFVEYAGDHGDKHAQLEIARWRGYVNTVGFGEDSNTAEFIAAADPPTVVALIHQLREAEQELRRLREGLKALHISGDGDGFCNACGTCWPCPTSRLLGGEQA